MQTGTRPISLVAKNAQTGRIVWADNAKAILITLVAFGHFSQLAQVLHTVVYAFHLPAFLFITGFFLPAKLRDVSFGAFCQKYIYPFARLYLLVTAASILLWWGAHIVLKHEVISPVDAILNGLYGTQWNDNRFIHKNGALWYLPFLVCSLLAFFAVVRLPVWGAIIVIVGYFCFGVFYTGYPLPWSAGAGGVGLTFIYAGFRSRIFLDRDGNGERFAMPSSAYLGIGVVSVAALLALSMLNGDTNLNLLDLGSHSYLYVLAAAAGILAVAAISAVLPRTWLADELSANSLLIFCIHLYGVKVINHLGLLSGQPVVRQFFLLAMAIIIVCGSMVVSKIAMPLVSKYVMGRGQ